MAALIWTLTWLSPVLPAMNVLPPPTRLNLSSDHFVHLLRWEQGAGTPPGVSYNVSVCAETGTSWSPVNGCQSVVEPLLCNLTQEFSEPSEVYFTKVTAYLHTQTSSATTHKGLKPIRDTALAPPLLSVAPCDRNLCVQLQPPLKFLGHIYKHLQYKLRVSSAKGAQQFFKDPVSLGSLVLESVASGRLYCVSVCVSDSRVNRHSDYSQPVCVLTPSAFTADALVSSLLCVLAVCGVVTLALLVSAGYICLRRRPLPLALASIHHIEEVLVLAAPGTSSFSPLYSDKSTVPSAVGKRGSTSSSGSSEEQESDSEGEGGEDKAYLSKRCVNLLSSSSSSSSSSASPCVAAPNSSSHLPPQPLTPHPEGQRAAETPPLAGHTHNLSTHIHSADRNPPHTPCPPTEGGEEDVNLLTLTFDLHLEEEEEEEDEKEEGEEPELSSNIVPSLLSLGVTVKTVSCPEQEEEEEVEEEEEEEEEEEQSGYIRH